MPITYTIDKYPFLAKQFDLKKNFPRRPSDLPKRSGIKIWWKCSKNHSWITAVYNRTRGSLVNGNKFSKGSNCAYCSGKKPSKENNLKILYPKLAREWHPIKNGNLKPEQVVKGYYKKIWWKCLNKGHEWQTSVHQRTNPIKYKFKTTIGTGCPYCSNKKIGKDNNLKIFYPKIASEWHPTKNGKFKPEHIAKGSDKKYWWVCLKGHEWQASPGSRTHVYIKKRRTYYGTKCPYCSGLKVTPENTIKVLMPELAKEWHPNKNGKLKPDMFAKFSSKKIWWICSKNHVYISRISQRGRGQGCPKCTTQSSKPELRILSELETIFKKIESRYKLKKVEIDIFIKEINVGIEYDGSYFHKNKREKDKKKNNFLKKNNIKLIRVRREPLKKINKSDILISQDEIQKKDINIIVKSIYNYCNFKQKKLIHKYIKRIGFLNNEVYKNYLSFFPGPLPSKSLVSFSSRLVNEWHYKKNYPLEPKSFYPYSSNNVWWKCSKGHEWISRIKFRSAGNNCPYCSGHRVNEQNNLEFLRPSLAKEWHPVKNGNLEPKEVTNGSNKKAWWLCAGGHEWKTSIANRTNRTNGTNCPYCYRIRQKKYGRIKL